MPRQWPGRVALLFLVSCFVGCASDTPGSPVNGEGAAGSTGGFGGLPTGGSSAPIGGAGGSLPVPSGAPAGGALTAGSAGQDGGTSASGQGGGSNFGGTGPSGAGMAGQPSGGGGSGGQASVPNAVESIAVRADGQAATSKASLDNGELYLLKATGIAEVGGVSLDAEYGNFTGSAVGQDSISGTDVGVDVGVKVERTPKGTTAGRKKWFGNYRVDHTYYLILTGSGAPLSLKLVAPVGAGAGAVTVSLFRLSPSAPALAPALETVLANVTKPTVRSTLATAAANVYLLQASGSGKTGGLNLALGDADWMDWAADGKGKVDIGDLDVDYGLGVDESDPTKTPRQHWWGPWRKDHSYFMLFAGTGATISFSYYDVGDYGDNSKTDKLTVHVFAVP